MLSEQYEHEQPAKAPSFEILAERFRAKMVLIPAECHEAIMYWKMAREVQKARIAAENKLRQVIAAGQKVFFAGDGIPDGIKAVMAKGGDLKHFEELRKKEDSLIRACETAFKKTRWYNEVALAAAEGIGLGPALAGDLLWIIGGASRFPTFGRLVRYAGLDVRDGKSPKRAKNERITWNPALRTTLYKLTEVWNKMPECIWRARWDGWKAWYAENRPNVLEEKSSKGVPCGQGHIHNMARRKVQREFLRNLWTLWMEYEKG